MSVDVMHLILRGVGCWRLPAGVTRILDMRHMRAAKATVLFDLGMGLGKLLLQSFFQYPNIRYVCGVELALSRYRLAEKALLKLVELEVRFATP